MTVYGYRDDRPYVRPRDDYPRDTPSYGSTADRNDYRAPNPYLQGRADYNDGIANPRNNDPFDNGRYTGRNERQYIAGVRDAAHDDGFYGPVCWGAFSPYHGHSHWS
jgi:hypothetical protein